MAHYIQDYLYAEMPEQYVTDIIQWLELEAIYDLPPANKYHYMTIAVVPGEKGQRFFLCEKDDEGYKWVEMHFSMEDYQAIVRELAKLQDDDKKLQGEIDDLLKQLEEAKKKLVDLPKEEGVYNLVVDSEGKPSYERATSDLVIPTSEGIYNLVVDSEGKPHFEEARPMIDIPEDEGDYMLHVDSEGKPEFVPLGEVEEPELTIDMVPAPTCPYMKFSDTRWVGDFRGMTTDDFPIYTGVYLLFKSKKLIGNIDFEVITSPKYFIDFALDKDRISPNSLEYIVDVTSDPEPFTIVHVQHRVQDNPYDTRVTLGIPLTIYGGRAKGKVIIQVDRALDSEGNEIKIPDPKVITIDGWDVAL